MKDTGSAAKGHLLAIGTIVVWGSTFIFSKILLTAFQPMQIMVMRFVLAYAVLWCLYPRTEKTTLKDELGMFGMALFANTVYFLCENNALRYTLAANVSILVASAPIWTAVLAHFFLPGSRLSRNIVWGFLVAFVGVAMVVFNGAVVLKFNPLGDVLSICAALSWAVYSMLVTRFIDRFSSFFLMRRLALYGLVTTLPLLFIEGAPMPWATLLEPKMFLSVLFLGIIGSGIAYVTWNMATRSLGIVRVSNYIYANPFVTLVTAAIFLGEPITVMGVAGAALIIFGVILGVRQKVPSDVKKPKEGDALPAEESKNGD